MIHGREGFLCGRGNNARRLDRLRDVVNEEDQIADADERQDQPDQHRQRRDKRPFVTAANDPEHHQAVGEDPDEHAEYDLIATVAHKIAQDARRVLAGGQRERHDGNGEHHPRHRDHRAGDGREQAASAGRTGAEEQRPPLHHMQIDGRVHGDQEGGEHHGVQNHHGREEPKARLHLLPPMVDFRDHLTVNFPYF